MDKNETSDARLVKDYLKGDEQAFDSLYRRYRQPVFSYLQGMLNNRERSEEIYQQTWVKAIANLPRYRHRDNFKAWILRIARNAAIDHFRRDRRFVEFDEKDSPRTDPAESPAGKIDLQETEDQLREAIAELPKEQKEVVLLRLEEISFKEIARIQQVSINTALARMRYAVKNLQDKIVK